MYVFFFIFDIYKYSISEFYIGNRGILITQIASCAMELLSVLARTRLRDFFIFPPVKCPKVLLFVTTNVRGNIALWSAVYTTMKYGTTRVIRTKRHDYSD